MTLPSSFSKSTDTHPGVLTAASFNSLNLGEFELFSFTLITSPSETVSDGMFTLCPFS